MLRLKNWQCITVLLLALSRIALAGDTRMMPVDTAELNSQNSMLEVGVIVPCGSEFLGISLSEVNNTLYVASVIRENDIACTSMPKYTVYKLPQLAKQRIHQVQPMPVIWGGEKIRIIEPTDLRLVQVGGSAEAQEVQMLFESQCGRALGTMVRPDTVDADGKAERYSVALVERMNPKVKKNECEYSQDIRRVDGLASSRNTIAILSAYKTIKSDNDRAYELNVRPIKRLVKGQHPVAIYDRLCNEAPIGFITGEPKKDHATHNITVAAGILVARMVNIDCSSLSAKPIEESYDLRDIKLSSAMNVVSFKNIDAVKISPPTQFTAQAHNVANIKGYAFDYIASCSKVIGAVYSRDWQGNMAVAVVHKPVKAEIDSQTCNKAPKEVSLFQPYLSQAVEREIYPLRVKGAPVY